MRGKVGEPTATVPEMTPPRPARRFPPPWTVEETDACFIVKDHGGLSLAYVYFEEEPGRRAAAQLLTRDEARRIRRQHRQAAGAAAAINYSGFFVAVTTALSWAKADASAAFASSSSF
jgi:hypothetical protein